MKSLKWHQVNAWRLLHHGLAPRLERQNFIQAVTRPLGIQAQVMSAAEMAIFSRVEGVAPEDIRAALWQERRLVKTWAMRGTLHLIAAEELPLYAAARSLSETRNWDSYFAYYGFSPAQQEAFLAAVPQVLGAEPMTRQQLAAAVARQTGLPQLEALILNSSWGSPLKPSAFRGELCFGPSQGQNVTFVNPRAWLGEWPSIEPQQALQEIARRYLQAYGPSTPVDFTRWWSGGSGISAAKKLFRSLGDEIEEVEVKGWRGVALRATLEAMERLEPAEMVQLLPLFDAYTLGLGRDIEPLLAREHKLRVYRPQGWISAVVLVNGFIRGVWQHKTGRGQTVVKVSMFSSPTASVRAGIEAEVERLGGVFESKVLLEYGTA